MKHLKIIAALIFCWSSVKALAQQVITSAGDDAKNGQLSISWTLGELSVESYSNDNTLLTQGQQQPPGLIIAGVGPDDEFRIATFPNPTTDAITLTVEMNAPLNLEYVLIDMKGQVIQQKEIMDRVSTISFSALPPAPYLLKVSGQNMDSKTFKIIKK